MFEPEPSPEGERARELWDHWLAERTLLIAPTLLRYEVTNAIYRPVRLGLGDADRGLSLIRSLDQLPLQYFDSIALNIEAFKIARDLNLAAAYDAHYVALARQENAGLYTADHRLVKAVAPRFDFVRYFLDE